jgi:hypothetical protein
MTILNNIYYEHTNDYNYDYDYDYDYTFYKIEIR